MATSPSSNKDISPEQPPVASTGVAGLDDVLHGGLPREEMHMVQGVAGTGKTTIALHFLREGVRLGEPCLYVTLSQAALHLERMAHSHGWSLDGITVHELAPATVADRVSRKQTVLPTTEVELDELFHDVEKLVKKVKPKRAVIDSITILQIVAGTVERYHREVVTLRQLFAENGCTVMVMADHPAEEEKGSPPEVIFHPLCGCVIQLSQDPRPYGDVRRRVRVIKARGLPHNGGYHDMKIDTGLMTVFPRLGAYVQPEYKEYRRIPSGIDNLDRILGGGVEEGTSCLIVGPSGVGKSSLATAFAASVSRAGGHSALFLLDERPETYITRSEGVGIPIRREIDAGRMLIRQLDPGEIAPGEFAQQVRELVEKKGTKIVVIDSVIGYFAAMGVADVLVTQLHELLTYLTRSGVLLIMCGAQEGFMSIGTTDGVDVSYLSDTILVLGFYESDATIHRCISAVKKKHGAHDTGIRELAVIDGRIVVGDEPLTGFYHLLLPDTRAVGGRSNAGVADDGG
ncbi:MAG TPA: ATPase domain-containing protein [Tepidisphaeraceae bacterium]|jgi:circadian clock protein KaiC|nr:ATPase domain-containing protein [Tepidisphaeraceae bacterium]